MDFYGLLLSATAKNKTFVQNPLFNDDHVEDKIDKITETIVHNMAAKRHIVRPSRAKIF